MDRSKPHPDVHGARLSLPGPLGRTRESGSPDAAVCLTLAAAAEQAAPNEGPPPGPSRPHRPADML